MSVGSLGKTKLKTHNHSICVFKLLSGVIYQTFYQQLKLRSVPKIIILYVNHNLIRSKLMTSLFALPFVKLLLNMGQVIAEGERYICRLLFCNILFCIKSILLMLSWYATAERKGTVGNVVVNKKNSRQRSNNWCMPVLVCWSSWVTAFN